MIRCGLTCPTLVCRPTASLRYVTTRPASATSAISRADTTAAGVATFSATHTLALPFPWTKTPILIPELLPRAPATTVSRCSEHGTAPTAARSRARPPRTSRTTRRQPRLLWRGLAICSTWRRAPMQQQACLATGPGALSEARVSSARTPPVPQRRDVLPANTLTKIVHLCLPAFIVQR